MSDETVLWNVQARRGHVWETMASGKSQALNGNLLGLGALAAHLMAVDHANDLEERRVLVKRPDGLSPRLQAVLTEDDLVQHLSRHGYYRACDEAPLAAFFPQQVHDSLPRTFKPS
ncbi:hypothetical protein [Streptomyces niveus]|uniref:hypothetical protein n=1 Tax=Streptomyces niveus TaxID=193462 RepID=UPI00367E2A57